MWNLLFLQIVAGIVGIFLAQRYVPGVEFTGEWQVLVLAGAILGLINFFIKPILKIITLPLRIITFGLFGLIINVGIIWLIGLIFPELVFPEQIIPKIIAIFWTSLIVLGINFILTKWVPTK